MGAIQIEATGVVAFADTEWDKGNAAQIIGIQPVKITTVGGVQIVEDRKGAVEAFRRAVHCKPQYSDAHRDLGELLAQDGQLAEAFVQLRDAFQLNPAEPRGKKLLEQVLSRIAIPIGP